jgi:hypothetical protein
MGNYHVRFCSGGGGSDSPAYRNPTPSQRQMLARTFGCARFVYTNVLVCQEASPFPNATLINGHTKPSL